MLAPAVKPTHRPSVKSSKKIPTLQGVDCGILRDSVAGSFTPVVFVGVTTEALSVLQAQVIILDCIRHCVLSANQETCVFCS